VTAWDGEGPDADPNDWVEKPDTFTASDYGDADEAFLAARAAAAMFAADGTIGAGWRIAPHGADGWRIVGPDGERYRALSVWAEFGGGRE
jgi:hypothetical protein